MEGVLKKRKAARVWLSKEVNRLQTACSSETPLVVDIKKGLQELRIKQERLEKVQNDVEDIISEEELESCIEEADDYMNDARQVTLLAERHLAALESTLQPSSPNNGVADQSFHGSNDNSNSSPTQGGATRREINAHLPKISIPKFSGNYTEWTEFWDKFSALVDKTDIPIISKFTYLQSYLSGEASATIRGLSLSEANYPTALSLLQQRFGRKERIILDHIQQLLNIEVPNMRTIQKLWQIYNDLQSNIRSLENLGVNGKEYGIVLTPIVLSRLPQEFRLEWARTSDGKESDLPALMEFFRLEISRRERSESYEKSKSSTESRREIRTPSAAALQTTGTTTHAPKYKRSQCSFCEKNHPSDKCWNLKKMSTEEIRTFLKNKGLCYRCFGRGHLARNCSATCSGCNGAHNKMFCQDTNNSVEHPVTQPSSNENCALRSESNSRTDSVNYHTSDLTNKSTVMQTLIVHVNGSPCTVLFDSGSDKSYVTSSFVRKVRPRYVGSEHVSHVCFGEKGPRNPTKRNVFEIECEMTDGKTKPVTVTEIPIITPPMFRSKIPENLLEQFETVGPVSLKQRFVKDESVRVDVLVGLDFYWQIMKSKIVTNGYGLVAQESVFGWVLSGSYPSSLNSNGECHGSGIHHQNLSRTELSDSLVRSFWELENLGIKTQEEREPDKAMVALHQGICFDGDRYEVKLPWKEERKSMLLNNIQHAKQRLESLERKLDKDPNLKDQYNVALTDLEKEGIIEEVPPNETVTDGDVVFYLPHRPVVKASSTTTKVRPVFDASASGPNGVSLNSCMHTGPYLTANLLDVLLRFRRWKYALTADITKAFFQINVHKSDRNVHRFLWKKDNSIRTMRLNRVPFGNTSSPFLLNGTIRHHLSQQEPSRGVNELMSNLYVDDWLTGADSVEEVLTMKSEATDIMARAGMTLTKWGSNSPRVAAQETHVLKEKDSVKDQHKVLGIQWGASEDHLSFTNIDLRSEDLIVTRRVVLSCISRMFDPLGMIQPFVMVAKIIFQNLWRSGLQWDEEVPEEQRKQFIAWASQLAQISQFSVPRCYARHSWENRKSVELHAFSDASEKGYGSCVYLNLVEEDNTNTTSLVIAKAKLAPIKRVTLPRLELLGALLSARLVTYVKQALQLPELTPIKCWTDSTVTLHWIRSDASRWKTFVANRVTEIQELTPPSAWGHCPGLENPADILSRGVMLDSLLESDLWLHGPSWLGNEETIDSLLQNEDKQSEPDVCVEELNNSSSLLTCEKKTDPVLPVERWGDFPKTVRITALVLRFIFNVKVAVIKGVKRTGDLTTDELREARNAVLRETQSRYFASELEELKSGKSVSRSSPLFKMKPFIAEDGLLRMKGRLHFSNLSYEEKHPTILPKCHISLLLARREHTTLNHAGVSQMISSLRTKFWIISLRSIVKQVKRHCVVCSRHDTRLPCQEPAPIPRKRIERSNPFLVTGVDYAGPVFTADCVGKKFYILLFTCAVIRAVHIELVDSLALPDFILAFKRFVARRGMPTTVISDNAKTFKAAAVSLVRELKDQSPKWEFITPRAPWCGGFWERLIKSVKLSLKKTVGLRSLSRTELETTLHQVEACINSRPLTVIHDDIENNEALTPSHFLLGRSDGHRPVGDVISLSNIDTTGHDLRQLLLYKNAELHKFWNIWHKEYIRNLPLIMHACPNKEVLLGTLCLIKEDNVSRIHWPLGRIEQIFPGKDRIVRTVKVKTKKGHVVRPMNKICCLEVLDNLEHVAYGDSITHDHKDNKDTSIDDCDNAVEQRHRPYVTRAGRVVQQRTLFNDCE